MNGLVCRRTEGQRDRVGITTDGAPSMTGMEKQIGRAHTNKVRGPNVALKCISYIKSRS